MTVVIKFVLKVVILAAAFYGMAYFHIPKGLSVHPNAAGPLGEFGTYLWIGLIFGVVNAFIKPVVKILAIPFYILTLGLVAFVINALMLELVAWLSGKFGANFEIDDFFWSAILAAIVVSIVSMALNLVLPDDD